MQFNWEKKGHIFKPDGSIEWMKSHAQGPGPIVWNGNIRTYFAARPSKNLTLPTFIDLEIDNPTNILYIHKSPILELGTPGTFDEHGIIPRAPIMINGRLYMYYIGWSRRTSVPYALNIGLAISDDGTNFKKYSEGPVLGVDKMDALSVTAPGFIYHNSMFYMFYTAGLKWFLLNNRWEHTYTIRMAVSKDGINWERDFKNAIEPKNEFECTSAPAIVQIENEFHMWYSYKGSLDFRNAGDESYRLGYATSKDLINWERKDDLAGINVSENKEAWDSEMIEYGTIIEINNKHYLFYNGNGFSESGFGYAELKIH